MNELIEYVKDKQGNRIGVVVASAHLFEGKEQVGIGWSLCHRQDRGVTFDKEQALMIARGRATTGSNADIPVRVQPVYVHMVERVAKSPKFFNNAKVCYWFVPEDRMPGVAKRHGEVKATGRYHANPEMITAAEARFKHGARD